MSNVPSSTMQYLGNKAFMELYNAIKDEMGCDKAADAVSRVYEGCGTHGYLAVSK